MICELPCSRIRGTRVWSHISVRRSPILLSQKKQIQTMSRRARAEANYQTRRAVKLASDDDEVKKLRVEVAKLLQQTSD
jgi:hypothetical protein